jgi:hypothetical protein
MNSDIEVPIKHQETAVKFSALAEAVGNILRISYIAMITVLPFL